MPKWFSCWQVFSKAIRYHLTYSLFYALKKTLQDDVGFVVRKRNGSRHPAIHIGALAYADDICLLAESIDDVECSFHRIVRSAAEIDLTINHNKPRRCTSGKPPSDTSASRMAILWIAVINMSTLGYPTPKQKRSFDLACQRHG